MHPDRRLARSATSLASCLVAAGLIASPLAALGQPRDLPSRPLPPQQPPASSPMPPAGPPAAAVAPAPAPQAEVSPPLRVGRVAHLQGTVSFHAADARQWVPATLNYPVTSSDGLWTQPGAEAEIEVSDSRIAMNEQTELDLNTLDASSVLATVAQGELFVNLKEIAPGESWTVQTPRGTVLLGGNGSYGIAAGDTAQPSVVTVLAGLATVTVSGTGAALQAGPGQAVVIEGTDGFTAKLQAARPDAFLAAMAARVGQAKPLPQGVSLPPMVERMPGCSQLASYGTWKPGTQYGTVWTPQVPSGWVPYRDGHWVYAAPWGWTWVDAAPWGFAPFHYGRWAQIDGAWSWVPGDYGSGVQALPQPVYAPALVTFVGPEGGTLGEAAFAGFAAGALVGGAIGWLPLGPREPYYPWFHARPDWVRDVNVGHVADPAVVVNNYTHNQFNLAPGGLVNRGAGTLVPATALMESRPVAGVGRPLPADSLARLQPIVGREPLRPGAQTAGLTPALATRLGVAGVAPRLAAPGPALAPPGVPGGVAGGVAGRETVVGGHGAPVPLHVVGTAPGVVAPEHGSLPPGPPVSGVARPGLAPTPGVPTPAPGQPALRQPTPGQPAASLPAPGAEPPGRASPERLSPEHASPEHASPEHASPEHPSPGQPSPGQEHGAPANGMDRGLVAHPGVAEHGESVERHAPTLAPPAVPIRPSPPARLARPPGAPAGFTVPHGPHVEAPRPAIAAVVPHVAPAVPHVAAPQMAAPQIAAPHFAAAVPHAPPHAAPPPGGAGGDHRPHHPP